MRMLLRKIMILAVAAGLALSGATPLAQAKIATVGTVSLHETHRVMHYADLAIEAEESECAHATNDSSIQPSHHDGPCANCCAACIAAGLVPDAPLPVLMTSQKRAPYAVIRAALVAHTVPTDPGIPKSL